MYGVSVQSTGQLNQHTDTDGLQRMTVQPGYPTIASCGVHSANPRRNSSVSFVDHNEFYLSITFQYRQPLHEVSPQALTVLYTDAMYNLSQYDLHEPIVEINHTVDWVHGEEFRKRTPPVPFIINLEVQATRDGLIAPTQLTRADVMFALQALGGAYGWQLGVTTLWELELEFFL
ncbi:MAG: hypothetical protein LQ352_001804, partial [Teloschistes flavicans]